VENRTGGATLPASEAVIRSAPDGSTLLLLSPVYAVGPALRENYPFDPSTSFTPVCQLTYVPTVFAVQTSSPYKTFGELVAAAKAPGSRITMAGVGPSTSIQIAIEAVKNAAKAPFVYVPFPGGTPAVTNLLGGHVTSVLTNYPEVQANLGTELRALAVGAPKRLPQHPEVPTLDEAGFPGVETTTWFGLAATANTPPQVIDPMIAAVKKALATQDVKDKLAAVGLITVDLCGAEFGVFLADKLAYFKRAVREIGLTPSK